MANRYWVGSSGNWSDDTNHWATSSNGLPAGGNLPTSSDNVFIDNHSGLADGTITLDVTPECNDFTSTTGVNYTIDSEGQFYIFGSITLESGLDLTTTSMWLVAPGAGKKITSNGCIFYYLFIGLLNSELENGEWILQDDLVVEGYFEPIAGIFDANNHNVTAQQIYVGGD